MENKTKSTEILNALEALADEEKRNFLPHFFKTGKGEYGEGDKFLGVVVPNIRNVVKQFRGADFDTISALLVSPWHEVRMSGLLLLVDCFKRDKTSSKEQIYTYYLSNTQYINNWDLVDLSAPYIVGAYLLEQPSSERDILFRLAESKNLWEQRIAVVSTITLIRHNEFDEIFRLAELLMNHPHDLMHKAIGWMLREVGKKNEIALRSFLDRYVLEMPRTMLRYSIERMEEGTRLSYLNYGKRR